MSSKQVLLAGLLVFPGAAQVARGQTAIPAPATTTTGTTTINLQPGAPAQPRTLWNFLGISKAGCAAHRERLCNSQLGLLLNNGLAPISGLTGGIIPQFCPTTPTADQLSKLEQDLKDGKVSPAVVAAAKVKADEADAKARVAAVEYLGTVDCNYWPEVTEALTTALRADKNECVRYAAARVLSNGCCCNKDTIRSLTIAAMGPAAIGPKGKTEDSEPAESSERVRCAAMIALQGCLANVPPEPIEVEPPQMKDPVKEEGPEAPLTPSPLAPPARPEEGPTGRTTGLVYSIDVELRHAAFRRTLAKKPMSQVVSDARRALEILGTQEPSLMMTGSRTLSNVVARARKAPKTNSTPMAEAPALRPAPSVGGMVEMPMMPPVPQPTPTFEPPAPMDLPPLPPGYGTDQAPPPAPMPAAPGVSEPLAMMPPSPAPAPVPVVAPQPAPSVQRDAIEQILPKGEASLPPLPPTSAAPAPTAASPRLAVQRTAYTPRPRAAARIASPKAANDPVAGLHERFLRTPDSYRGDLSR